MYHKACTCSFLSKSVHVMVKNIAQHILKHLNRYDIGCVIGMQSINMYKLGLLCGSACFSRPSHVVDARAGCLIRPVSELIVKGILLLLCGHASCTNMGISHAKHSTKKGRSMVWMPSNRYSLQQSRQGIFASFSLQCTLDSSCPIYWTTIPSIHPWPPLVNVALWVMGWLYSALKQLRSWIQPECVQPRALDVNELAFLQPEAKQILFTLSFETTAKAGILLITLKYMGQQWTCRKGLFWGIQASS